MQRASGSQHLQQLPLPSVIPNTAPQQTPTSSSSVPHGGSDSHRHSPTANLAAVLARAAHNSPALLPNPKAADASANAGVHGNAEVGTAERASVAQQSQAGVAVQRLPAARAKLADAGQPGLPSGLSAIAPAEQPTRPDSGHSASRPGGSSSSSASFDSWRLNGQKHDGTDSAPTSLINMSPLQMGTPTQSPAAEATLRQSDAAAAAIPQRGIRDRIIGKEGWTDSQVQQSGLMPGRQHRQFGQPHMPLHSPPAWQNNPRRRKDALKPAKAGRIVLLGAPLTPLSAQGSTGPMPWADGQRQGLSPAGSESSSRFRGAAAELSPLATALASIRYLL